MFIHVYLYLYAHIFIHMRILYVQYVYIYRYLACYASSLVCQCISLSFSLRLHAWRSMKFMNFTFKHNLLQVEPSTEQIIAAMTSLVTNHDEEHGGAGKVSFAEFQSWYVLDFVWNRACVRVSGNYHSPLKTCLKFMGTTFEILWKNLFEILAVVIIWSAISSARGIVLCFAYAVHTIMKLMKRIVSALYP